MIFNSAPGEDFSLVGSMVTFDVSSATNDERCLDVVVIGDFDYESDETAVLSVTVTMVGQAGATNSVTLTINNDDDRKQKNTMANSVISSG